MHRLLPLLLLAGCIPKGRADAEITLIVQLATTPSTWELVRLAVDDLTPHEAAGVYDWGAEPPPLDDTGLSYATGHLEQGTLLTEHEGRLATPLLAFAGPVDGLTVHLGSGPTLRLQGTVPDADGAEVEVAFTLDVTDLTVDLPLEADLTDGELLWTLDPDAWVASALAVVDLGDDGVLTEADDGATALVQASLSSGAGHTLTFRSPATR